MSEKDVLAEIPEEEVEKRELEVHADAGWDEGPVTDTTEKKAGKCWNGW